MENPEKQEATDKPVDELEKDDLDISQLSKKLQMARIEAVLLFMGDGRDLAKINELQYLLSICGGIERSLNNLKENKENELRNICLLEMRLFRVQERPEGKNKQEEIDSIQDEIKRIKEKVRKINEEIKIEWQEFLDSLKNFEEAKKAVEENEHEQNQIDDD